MIYANWRAEKGSDELNSSVQLIAPSHVLHAAVRHCWTPRDLCPTSLYDCTVHNGMTECPFLCQGR